MIDARRHGADIVTYHEVTGFLRTGDRIRRYHNAQCAHRRGNGRHRQGHNQCRRHLGTSCGKKAGIEINMFPAKGSLLIFGHRVNNKVINRCRKPANADILVPGDTICLIGTTSDRIPFDQIDNMDVTPEEVDVLLREDRNSPPPSPTHASSGPTQVCVRWWPPTMTRPAAASAAAWYALDHAKRDGVEGFITITGGKLMTYRLMAEEATDMACRKLGAEGKKCETAHLPLPGSEQSASEIERHDKKREKKNM